jgi:hypothetical protein
MSQRSSFQPLFAVALGALLVACSGDDTVSPLPVVDAGLDAGDASHDASARDGSAETGTSDAATDTGSESSDAATDTGSESSDAADGGSLAD